MVTRTRLSTKKKKKKATTRGSKPAKAKAKSPAKAKAKTPAKATLAKAKPVAVEAKALEVPAPARSAAQELLQAQRRRRLEEARLESRPDEAPTAERDQQFKAYSQENAGARQHEHFLESNQARIRGHFSDQTRRKQGRRDAQEQATAGSTSRGRAARAPASGPHERSG